MQRVEHFSHTFHTYAFFTLFLFFSYVSGHERGACLPAKYCVLWGPLSNTRKTHATLFLQVLAVLDLSQRPVKKWKERKGRVRKEGKKEMEKEEVEEEEMWEEEYPVY